MPQHVLESILGILDRNSVRYTRAGFQLFPQGYNLLNFNDLIFDLLPKIQFIVETSAESGKISIAILDPREYIQPISDGQHYLRLQWYPETPTEFEDNECSIDASIFRNLVIHFDSRNRRIGFGEPLVGI